MNVYKNKSVFLTGDTGFKGSWLAIWLMELGARVTGYALPPIQGGHFAACGLQKRFRHVEGDISDTRLLERTMRDCRPDFAFHLAAQPLVLESYRAPVYTFNVNIMGTARFLEAARSCGTLRACVVVTTDKVYDNPEQGRAFRENDPLGGDDPYSASKAGAEIVVQSYAASFFRESRCGLASARAGNVMGGGDFSADRIVPDCVRALREKRPVILRNPEAIRPWQHVLEPLRGYLLLGAALLENRAKYSGAWNFGPDQRQNRTVLDLAKALTNEWGEGRIVPAPGSGKRPREAGHLRLDSGKARRELSWKPVLSFDDTIRRTVREYLAMEKLPESDLFESRRQSIREYMKKAAK